MPGCEQLVFDDFSEDDFRRLSAKAASIGISLDSPVGVASKDGFLVAWRFEPERRVLLIKCLSRPSFVSCDTIIEEIEDLVSQSTR